MATGGDRNDVWMFSAISTPKKIGSMPKLSSSGRKIGTKITTISVHSRGQPSTKMMICVRIRNQNGDRFRPVTKFSMGWWPPRKAKIDEKMKEPTKSQHTMAEVRAVRMTDSRSLAKDRGREGAARSSGRSGD